MIKRQLNNQIITEFTGYVKSLTPGTYRPTQKMIEGVMLGMMLAKAVLLSEITRAYQGIPSGFRSAHKRFCRGLASFGWDVSQVQGNYLTQTVPLIKNSTVIAVDIGDITKTRARRRPQMTTVRDGSTGALKKGWWLLERVSVILHRKQSSVW